MAAIKSLQQSKHDAQSSLKTVKLLHGFVKALWVGKKIERISVTDEEGNEEYQWRITMTGYRLMMKEAGKQDSFTLQKK